MFGAAGAPAGAIAAVAAAAIKTMATLAARLRDLRTIFVSSLIPNRNVDLVPPRPLARPIPARAKNSRVPPQARNATAAATAPRGERRGRDGVATAGEKRPRERGLR